MRMELLINLFFSLQTGIWLVVKSIERNIIIKQTIGNILKTNKLMND